MGVTEQLRAAFQAKSLPSLVPRLHSPAFYHTINFIHGAIRSWGAESGNEAEPSLFGRL